VAPQGELDIATAPQLQAEFDRIRARDGLERIVVDLRDLVFLDSTGLETIVKLDALAARDGYSLAVVRGPRAVERLFAVMQLDRRLQMVDDPGELA
jgi:anti-anti-sigma factor